MDGLVLYLKLDKVEDGRLRDQSSRGGAELLPSERGGLEDLTRDVGTPPQTVADATFGSCLSFDGQQTSLELPSSRIPTGPELTVSLWLNGADSLPRDTSIIQANDANGVRMLNMHVPWDDGHIYFDCGNDGANYDRIEQQAQPADYKGAWVHWAFVKNVTTGEMHIYRNGAHWLGGTGMVRPIPPAGSARLGAMVDGSCSYAGKMAHLRIFNRALGAEEIGQVMIEDQTNLAAFRASYPLDFDLHNADDEPVLFITDTHAGHDMHLDIVNASERVIDITPTGNPTASDSNYHFAVRFRPGILAPSFLQTGIAPLRAALQPEGWDALVVGPTGGPATIYLLNLSTQAVSLQPDFITRIPLPNLSANGLGGERGTQVEINYQNLTYQDEPTPIQGRRLLHLSILNDTGQQAVPLYAGFTGSPVVVNDGHTANSLTLAVGNLLGTGAIALNPETNSDPSRFVLSFDTQKTGETKNWALGTSAQVSQIQVPSTADWHIVPQTQGQPPEWIVTTAKTQLAAGEAMVLALGNIITSLPTGPANLYVRYENIPGYQDGQLVAQIQKAPLPSIHCTDLIWANNSRLRNDQGGSLELGGDDQTAGVGTPYIDFHYNGKAQDANVRVVNDADGQLSVRANVLQVTGSLQGNSANFKSDVTWANNSRLRNDQGGSLELGGDDQTAGVGTPYIDFHYNGKTQDANVRVINDADGQLTVRANTLQVNGNVRVGGNNAVQQGINFQMTPAPVNDHANAVMGIAWITSDAIRVVGGSGGVLATKDRDVLLWMPDTNNPAKGSVFIKGSMIATDKYFRIDHPTRPDHDLVHGCLEGPELGVYYRGQAQLRDGRATIRLPDYFEALTRPEGRTVQLTARGREPFLLSYEDIVDGVFRVYGTRPDGAFCWEVKAVRADVAPLAVEVPK
jgi:hypothetical protein